MDQGHVTRTNDSSSASQLPDSLPASQPLEPLNDVNEVIILQVGSTRFVTTAATVVKESRYFRRLLLVDDTVFANQTVSTWSTIPMPHFSMPEARHFFIDANPTYFEDILQYMRRGTKLVKWDKVHGFDYAYYQIMLHEAEFFGLDKLSKWIRDGAYAKSIKVNYETKTVEGDDDHDPPATAFFGHQDSTSQINWVKDKIYTCPRGIAVHRGNREKCGRACMQAEAKCGSEYEEEDMSFTTHVIRTVEFELP